MEIRGYNVFPGFRPTALVLFSLIWFGVGLGLITRGAAPLNPEHRLPLEYLPIWLRVALWWGPALLGLVAAFWPPQRDRWGWVLLSIPASFRAASYLFAGMIGWIDFSYAVSWVVICGILTLLAFWPEPIREGDLDA